MDIKRVKLILEKLIENESWNKIHDILANQLNSSFFWIADFQGNFVYKSEKDHKFCEMIKNNPVGLKNCDDSTQFLIQHVINKKEMLSTSCHAGFLEFTCPLIVNNEVIGAVGGCQFIDINLDFELYYAVAKELFLKIEDFLSYISKEPSISSSDLEAQIKLINLVIKNTLDSIDKDIKVVKKEEKETYKIKDFHDLFEASKELVLNLEPKKLYPLIVEMARKAMNIQTCSLMLIDEEKEEMTIKAAYGLSDKVINSTHLKLKEGLVGYVIRTGKPLLVKDVEKDTRVNMKHKPERYHTKSLIISPLKVENKIIGVLNVNNKEDYKAFNEDDLNLLSIICGHAAIAIENSKAYEKVKRDKVKVNIQARELSILHDIGHELALRHIPEEILELSLAQVLKIFNCDFVSYLIIEGQEIKAKVSSLYSLSERMQEQLKEHLNKSMDSYGFSLNLRQNFFLKTVSKSYKKSEENKDISSYIAYPLKDESEVIGVIAMGSLIRKIFLESERKLFSLISKQISVNIKRALVYKETKVLTERDDLTNVYNYRFFKKTYHDEFEKAIQNHKPISLIMLDFDHLKMYNDKYGHQQGSFIIKKIALLIEKEVKDKGWISRFGGDEFSIVLPNTSEEYAYLVADSIRKNISCTTVNLNGDLQNLTASLGVATFSGYESAIKDGKDLLEWADKALYQAKDEGRNRVCQYKKE
ncbi:MAG: diguanylate cyclase [bacterium]|nr:diguanylate cyclase [bacterium]